MKKKGIAMIILGVIIIILGIVLIKNGYDKNDILNVVSNISLGFSILLIGKGVGKLVEVYLLKDNPELDKYIKIAVEDERNNRIKLKSKAKAFDNMMFIFLGLIISFIRMENAWKFVIPLCIAYSFVGFSPIHYQSKYEKEM